MSDPDDAPIGFCGLVVRGARNRDAFLLSLHGELDIATSPVLQRRLHMVQAPGIERLVLDMSGLAFLDSAGLRTLVAAQDQLHAG